MKQLMILGLLLFGLQACTWVKLSDDAQKVRVLDQAEVRNCKKLGMAVVSLKAKIAGFDRDEKKVKQELETLGRNTAIELDGDTIVPVSDIQDGKQTFDVYRCINP